MPSVCSFLSSAEGLGTAKRKGQSVFIQNFTVLGRKLWKTELIPALWIYIYTYIIHIIDILSHRYKKWSFHGAMKH